MRTGTSSAMVHIKHSFNAVGRKIALTSRHTVGGSRWAIRGSSPGSCKNSTPILETTQPSVQWVPGLRMSGAIPLLPLYAVMARTGTAFPSTFSPSASNLPLYDLLSEVNTREQAHITADG